MLLFHLKKSPLKIRKIAIYRFFISLLVLELLGFENDWKNGKRAAWSWVKSIKTDKICDVMSLTSGPKQSSDTLKCLHRKLTGFFWKSFNPKHATCYHQGGQNLCNFCLSVLVDLKLGMQIAFGKVYQSWQKSWEKSLNTCLECWYQHFSSTPSWKWALHRKKGILFQKWFFCFVFT